MYIPEELNEVQRQAVLDTEGAVLVTAGAGSGKTRLLTHRIAHLVKDLGVPPYNILAITFTNKAAEEMRSRLESMIDTDGIWVFTFHAACVRILRMFADEIGFSKNFTIYGEPEIKSIVKRICKENNYGDDFVKPCIANISKAKNSGISPDGYADVFKFASDGEETANVYRGYQRALRTNNAFDYDDLLIETLRLLKNSQKARDYLQNKFRYIHIDEFQDTNIIQYDIARILAGKFGNIFAVGDEDQCIYSWRGAAMENIFNFQKDFAGCKVYKLEQNYRSTSSILNVANRIIKGNSKRLDKKLWTSNGDGSPVVCFCAATEGFEADYVVRMIHELVDGGDFNYSDCAVLLRLNALSRVFEERFLQYGIPHRIYGGFKFYDRKEVRDALAYARLAVNPDDNEAAIRIINFPKRAIGESSIEKITEYAQENKLSVFHIATHADETPFPSTLKAKLASFGETLGKLRNEAASGDVLSFFRYLLFDVLRVEDIFSSNDDDRARLENLNELVNSVKEFAQSNENAMLEDYLQMISLYSDADEVTGDNAVTVATVHAAKGLEFPVVFVVGLEDGIFPSIKQSDIGQSHIEEERRLMYVAVTRAKQRLFLTYAKSRYLYGETNYRIASRFLTECGLIERTQEYSDGEGSRSINDFIRTSARRGGEKPTETFGAQKFSGEYKSDYGKKQELQKQPKHKSDISIGAKVMHKRLGKGTVIGVEQMGDNTYAKIDFERGGVMLLAVDFAPITVIEEK